MLDSLLPEEWWFDDQWLIGLLFFIAMSIGWLLGRRSPRHTSSSRNGLGIHSDYFKGLNYVLNEQPDKAIEIFVKMLEVDSETVETHLALGNLFRRRGEVDRAIRIHQNLIARPTLSREHRSLAMLQLGRDYMGSGLFDRAEGLFQELIATGDHKNQAYSGLLDMYQQERDWTNAIEAASNLRKTSADIYSQLIAQFYCEQVTEELLGSDKESDAVAVLRKALKMDPNCVRASLLEGKLAYDNEHYRQAIKSYLRVEKQDSAFLSETIAPLHKIYTTIEKKQELKKYLERVVEQHGSITATLYLVNLIAEEEGQEHAIKFITNKLQTKPSVRGVDKLIEYVIAQTSGETKESLLTIKELTGKLLTEKSFYRCHQCGFEGKTLYWQCPSCKAWAMVKPIQGVSGE